MPSFKTSLARAEALGSAKSGAHEFWLQRVTSLLGLPLTVGTIAIVLLSLGAEHVRVVARLHHPAVAALLLLTTLNFCIHMRIGMQVIIEDYVHKSTFKALLLIANTGFCAVTGALGVLAILKVAISG